MSTFPLVHLLLHWGTVLMEWFKSFPEPTGSQCVFLLEGTGNMHSMQVVQEEPQAFIP